MYLLYAILFILFFIILTWHFFQNQIFSWTDSDGTAVRFFTSALISLWVSACLTIVVGGIVNCIYEAYKTYDEYIELSRTVMDEKTAPIVSVTRDSSEKGSFALGFGTIEGDSYFVYYVAKEDGGKFLEQVESDKATVYDVLQDDESPYVKYKVNGLGHILSYELYVPEGSITEEYDF